MLRRQKAAAPQARKQWLIIAAIAGQRDHHHECRQVVVLASQTVAQPGAKAGPARNLVPRLNKRDGWVVINGFGVQGLDNANVVGDLRGVRQKLADPSSALTVLREFEDRRSYRQCFL